MVIQVLLETALPLLAQQQPPEGVLNSDTFRGWAGFILLLAGAVLFEAFGKKRYGESKWYLLPQTLLIVGAVGSFIQAVNADFLNDFSSWLTGLVGIPQGTSLGGFVAITLILVVRLINIPWIPEPVERGVAGLLFVIGGFVMNSSEQWTGLFVDTGGLIVAVIQVIGSFLLWLIAVLNLFLGTFGAEIDVSGAGG